MNQQEFWSVIDEVKTKALTVHERPDVLKDVLKRFSEDKICGFYENYRDKLQESYTWSLWGAAYVIMGGCSDDGFDYFRDWLISEGEKVYVNALSDPETLADLEELEEPELEGFRYAIYDAYEEKFDQDLPTKPRDFKADPDGEEWDEDSVDKQYPRLAKIYW